MRDSVIVNGRSRRISVWAIESLPEPCRTVVLVAVLTGLRIGEIAALRWSRVDFFRNVLEVKETYSDETGFGTTKTRSSVREVPLSEPLRIALLAHRAPCSGTNGDAFVFASKASTPTSPKNMAHRVLRPSCVRLGLRPIGWHALRHNPCNLAKRVRCDHTSRSRHTWPV